MERDWASDTPNILTMAFRGSAKSTKAEEAITLEVAFQHTRNVLILGESEERAAERLAAIKNHIEYNEELNAVFSLEPGDPWTTTRACTSTGVMMQAYGRGQSLRGVKHLDDRPDLIFGDDIEDPESASTPDQRRKTYHWWMRTVRPIRAPGARTRLSGTPLHPEALLPELAKDDKFWVTKIIPIMYKDDAGEWESSWVDRYPIEDIFRLREEMRNDPEGFAQEYLCQATDPGSRVFTAGHIRVVPRERSWHAVYAIYDPARTTHQSSATTGKAVASWIGRKLVVWESSAKKWMPSEIIDDIFNTEEKWKPTAICVEENGLNEWLLQPIRSESVKRGIVLPLRALQAPRGKLDFIRGLQKYFTAGEVEFAEDMPELRAQLLGFPTGLIDAPNALAYMLKLGLGVPVYDNFREECIDASLKIRREGALWLLINTNSQMTSAILVQMQEGRLCILADWLVEADAGACLTDIVKDAQLQVLADHPSRTANSLLPTGAAEHGSSSVFRCLSSRQHFDGYSIHGLKAAAKAAKLSLSPGGESLRGREELRAILRRTTHGRPALATHPEASWTLRALAGGYARDADRQEPQQNAYALLIDPLEAFAALSRQPSELDSSINYEYTSDGRRYISALAR